MHIKELSIAEFEAFARTSILGTHYQSTNYALFMTENNFDYDLVGLVDELGVIKAAALILIKKIGLSYKYGYSPRGFLIDYFDYDLVKTFTECLKEYYAKKLDFIKINPEIAIGEINTYNKLVNYNQNIVIRDYLKEFGYHKLKDNLNFESILPRFTGIVNLDEYNFHKLKKNTKNKIRKAEKKGLTFEKVGREGIDYLFHFIKYKRNVNEFYYKNYFNCFDKDGACDIFLVKIDYKTYLINSKELYDKELIKNSDIADKLINKKDEGLINQKMNSDRNLLNYKNDIEIATKGLRENKNDVLAAAFVTKYKNIINITISGYDPNYKQFNANYYLHYKILEYYKTRFKFVDLNGMSGDFSASNKYKGLNEFKLGFNPHVYEFIGEYDLIINEKAYYYLIKKGLLAKEFNKH